MAKMRSINTKFWTDPFVSDLTIKETLLFLYLLTNPHTNMAGVYELSLRQMSFESKLMPAEIQGCLQKFRKNNKVFYEKGWIIIINFVKNQSLNPSVKKGIEKDINTLPGWLKDFMKGEKIDSQTTLFDTSLSTASDSLREMKLIEANLIEANITQADKSAGFIKKQLDQKTKAQYAKSVKADEALAKKQNVAAGRGYSEFTKAREILKARKI